MAESLFLNKKKIDIYKKAITRRIQIGDVSEITERKSSFSYTIKIPKTSNNLEVLEMLSTIGNTSLKPFQEVVADYVVDNVYLIENGVAIIRSVDEDDISINLIDGFRGLSNLLGEKKLNEIDFSDLNHTINSEVLVASFENIEGYIYGFADFGKGVRNSVGQYTETQAPSIFLHTIIERIFEEAGFDLTGDFLTNDTKYLNEVLTPCNGYEVTPAGTTVVISEILGDIKQIDIIKDLANRHGLLMKPNSDVSGFEFKKLQEVLNDRTTANDWSEKVNNFKNEEYKSGYSQINKAVYDYAEGAVQDLDGELLVDNFNANLEKEIFKSAFEIPAVSSLFGFSAPLPAKEIFSVPIWGAYEQKIANIEAIIEKDSQTAERLKQDGTRTASGVGVVNKYTVDIYNEALSEYNTYSIKGWVYQAGFAMVCYYDSSDVFISYEFAGAAVAYTNVKASITVPNSTKYIRISGTPTFEPILYEYKNFIYDSAEVATIKPKIMYIDRLASYIQFEYFGAITTVVIEGQDANAEYIPYLSTKFMSLQYSLDNNYKSFKDILNNYKKIDLVVNLSLIDIYNLDFFRLKYLKQTGRFYYVNNIQYTSSALSKCEALELAKFAENYPPIISNFIRQVQSVSVGDLYKTNISRANFIEAYYDKEFDEPLKVKIISGFNSNIKIYQDAVEITSEAEIDFVDLNLTVEALIGDYSTYSESFEFNIMDSGSESYSENSAFLTVKASGDFLAAIKPTANGSLKTGESSSIVLGVESKRILTGKLSSSPLDDGDDIKYFEFMILTKPASSTAYIEENIEDYEGTIVFSGVAADLGSYTIRLTVTSLSGITDVDEFNLTITET